VAELEIPAHLPPTTTRQEDISTAGQRKINLIWESTQAFIAIIVVLATMASGLRSAFLESGEQIPTIMSVAFGTVVGFYFSRTNHFYKDMKEGSIL